MSDQSEATDVCVQCGCEFWGEHDCRSAVELKYHTDPVFHAQVFRLLTPLRAEVARLAAEREQMRRAADAVIYGHAQHVDTLRATLGRYETALRRIATICDSESIRDTGYGPSWSDIQELAAAALASTTGEPEHG